MYIHRPKKKEEKITLTTARSTSSSSRSAETKQNFLSKKNIQRKSERIGKLCQVFRGQKYRSKTFVLLQFPVH